MSGSTTVRAEADSSGRTSPPIVSVILPTFNRARFIPEAFASIHAQHWPHWELIVVDDGSTDDTRDLIERCRRTINQPVQYVYQANRGAYAARNAGLDRAKGDFIAFFDSDDLWLPEYLERSVDALERASDLDWVYVACRSVDEASGRVIAPSTFYVNGSPRAFLAVGARQIGDLRILDGPAALRCQLTSGLYAGLQNSVIRRRVFDAARFWDDYRVVEDVLFLLRALCNGLCIGYMDSVQVIYRVHDDNSSASVLGAGAARLLPIFEEEVRGFERLREATPLSEESRSLLEHELGGKYFWRLGYAGYWQLGRHAEALQAFRTGLRLRPRDWRMWKTYALCRLRALGRS